MTTARVAFTGGLKLPGRVRKWSTLCPPVLNAVAPSLDAEVRVELASARRARMRRSPTRGIAEGGVLVASLDELGLQDGDYEIDFLRQRQGRVAVQPAAAVLGHPGPRLLGELHAPGL